MILESCGILNTKGVICPLKSSVEIWRNFLRVRQHADRRVRKTQNALYLALAELMREKSVNSITVSELAEKADIHRATFYSHYADIDELYIQIQKNTLAEIERIFAPDPIHGINMNGNEIFSLLVQFIQENKEIFRMFLAENNARNFYEQLGDIVEEIYLEVFWKEAKGLTVKENVGFLAKYHVQGCLSVLSAWAASDYQEPAQKVIDSLSLVDSNFDRLMFGLFA